MDTGLQPDIGAPLHRGENRGRPVPWPDLHHARGRSPGAATGLDDRGIAGLSSDARQVIRIIRGALPSGSTILRAVDGDRAGSSATARIQAALLHDQRAGASDVDIGVRVHVAVDLERVVPRHRETLIGAGGERHQTPEDRTRCGERTCGANALRTNLNADRLRAHGAVGLGCITRDTGQRLTSFRVVAHIVHRCLGGCIGTVEPIARRRVPVRRGFHAHRCIAQRSGKE
ncbi:unannotated protein [freshwater metagenome]|uniref:Unannotated protein n=1 Tax=freshwater metagenome TaxID=449393 RepID=A0A6J7AMC7_9ZZZZ